MAHLVFEIVNLDRKEHRNAVVALLNEYMMDDMGAQKPFESSMHDKVLNDLKQHPSYTGFLLKSDTSYVALANCFVNYSTFQAKHLINIHDYIVSSNQRGNGFGKELLNQIIEYAKECDYCRLSLEVRDDNVKAKALYQKLGFKPDEPNMLFWEKDL